MTQAEANSLELDDSVQVEGDEDFGRVVQVGPRLTIEWTNETSTIVRTDNAVWQEWLKDLRKI